MGKTNSVPRIYANFEGEKKSGESRILRNVAEVIKPDDPGTMLEELEYTSLLSLRVILKGNPDAPFLGTRAKLRNLF